MYHYCGKSGLQFIIALVIVGSVVFANCVLFVKRIAVDGCCKFWTKGFGFYAVISFNNDCDQPVTSKKVPFQALVIVREHTPLTNLFMCLWFNEVVRFTALNQLSFPYVLKQLGVLKNVNLFPVCTHKDLVNSMGHKRKARSQIS